MKICNSPISDGAVRHYLETNANAAATWMGFIQGAVQIPMEDVKNFTAPELSVYIYCLRKKQKRDAKFYSSLLGGETK